MKSKKVVSEFSDMFNVLSISNYVLTRKHELLDTDLLRVKTFCAFRLLQLPRKILITSL